MVREICVGTHLKSMSFDEFFFTKKNKKKLTMKKGQILIRKHNLWHKKGTKNFTNKPGFIIICNDTKNKKSLFRTVKVKN